MRSQSPRNAVWLARQGWTVTGVDFSDAGLDKGRRLANERGVDVTWVCADATTWDPPDDGYDLVAVFDCLHDMGDPVGAAAHTLQALKHDGTMMLVEPFAYDDLEDNLKGAEKALVKAQRIVVKVGSRSLANDDDLIEFIRAMGVRLGREAFVRQATINREMAFRDGIDHTDTDHGRSVPSSMSR